MARDPQDLRRLQPTSPTDANDPPRFAQPVETVKDAVVGYLRASFEAASLTEARRAEAPTVEKYAFGSGGAPGFEPYETYLSIYQEYPDVLERLPHIAVTAASVTDKPRDLGTPYTGQVQAPPRIVTTEGPWTVADTTPQSVVVEVLTLPIAPTVYTLSFDGAPVTYFATAGESATGVLAGLRAACLDASVDLDYSIVSSVVDAVPRLTFTTRSPGAAPVLTGSSNLTLAVSVVGAGGAARWLLAFRTTGVDPDDAVVTNVYLSPTYFNDRTAATAVELVTCIRAQSKGRLDAALGGVGGAVRISTPGTPSELEVDVSSTPAAVTALGLGVFGTAAPGDGFTGLAPDMTLTIAGASFTVALVGRYLVVEGSALNDGRFRIVDVPSPTTLLLENVDGETESVGPGDSWSWFIGARDDWRNAARLPGLGYEHCGTMQLSLDILAESPNVRREVADLTWTSLTFFAEERFRTLHGRGVFSENYPDEVYQVLLGEASASSDQDFPRGEDVKDRIYAARLSLTVTWSAYLARPAYIGNTSNTPWHDATFRDTTDLGEPT